MKENRKCLHSEALRRSSRLPRKHREQIKKLQSEDEYKKFLRGLPPKERVFLLADYGYKFSKSDPSLAEYFAEGRYAPYVPGALSLDPGHGLSFMIEKEILLKASIYGISSQGFLSGSRTRISPTSQMPGLYMRTGCCIPTVLTRFMLTIIFPCPARTRSRR